MDKLEIKRKIIDLRENLRFKERERERESEKVIDLFAGFLSLWLVELFYLLLLLEKQMKVLV